MKKFDEPLDLEQFPNNDNLRISSKTLEFINDAGTSARIFVTIITLYISFVIFIFVFIARIWNVKEFIDLFFVAGFILLLLSPVIIAFYKLFLFGSNASMAKIKENNSFLIKSFKNLKNYFKIMTILIISIFCLTLLFFLIKMTFGGVNLGLFD